MSDFPKISKAYELRPGAVYALKIDAHLTPKMGEIVGQMISEWQEIAGCRFIVLEKDFDLVEPPQDFRYEVAVDGTITVL